MRLGRVLVLAGLSLLSGQQAIAGPVLISAKPESVAVTVYRSNDSQNGEPLDLEGLSGYALITETRRISLPAGDATIRFEGVAGGIIPVSAVVTGLPGGVIQKNRDARLLTPAALVEGSYGRMLHLKRTSRKTGKVTEEDAQLLAGPQGGILLRTRNGIEALGCDGLPTALGHNGVPDGLTDKPTLSIETRSKQASEAVVQLSYLANGFDWAASYVLRVGDKPGSFHMFAWLTLANGNAESFPDARTQAVAGKVNREDDPEHAENSLRARVSLSCWPMDITSTHPAYNWSRLPFFDGRKRPPGVLHVEGEADAADIIVTAQRREQSMYNVPEAIAVMSAKMEALGDLKLYRIPEPVTVAANAQKQVALITEKTVTGGLTYGLSTPFDYEVLQEEFDWRPMLRVVRFRNDAESGLGLPLPAGAIAIFDSASGESIPIPDELEESGELLRLEDTAVGQESFFVAGESPQVMAKLTLVKEKDYDSRKYDADRLYIEFGNYRLSIANANAFPVDVEIPVLVNCRIKLKQPSERLIKRKGIKAIVLTLEANSSHDFSYTLKPR